MVNNSDWKRMKQHAFDTFARDGGMSVRDLEEIVDISSNGTKLIVGRVNFVELPDDAVAADGSIALTTHQSLASTALDTYFTLTEMCRLPYAKARPS